MLFFMESISFQVWMNLELTKALKYIHNKPEDIGYNSGNIEYVIKRQIGISICLFSHVWGKNKKEFEA